MKRFFGVFNRRNSLLLLGFYTFLSFLLMTWNSPMTLRSLRISVLQLIKWVNVIEQQFVYLDNLAEKNKKLRKQNLEFSMTNQRLQEIMMENIRLRRLLQFKRESNYRYIPARVIGMGQERTVSSLILNVGSEDSVRKNMPLVTDRGLVGKILTVDAHQCIAQILMDRNSLVGARLQRSREIGVVGWSGNIWLDLNYIPKDIPVEPGEAVITSGLSRIYPAGLKIGVVGEVEENSYELFKQIKVKPAVNFNSLEEVFVLVPPDSLKMERAAGD